MLLSKRVTTFNLFKDLAMRSGSIMDKMLAEKSRFSMAQLSESRDSSNCFTCSVVWLVLARFNFLVFYYTSSNMGNMGKEKGCKLICWKPATRRIDKYFLVLIQSAVMWSSVLSLIFHFDLILAFPRMVVVMLI